jgi:hypothetical protein
MPKDFGQSKRKHAKVKKRKIKEQEMKSRIHDIARYTINLLNNLDCNEEVKKLKDADEDLQKATSELKNLNWEHLFAIEDEKRQELTTHQQKCIECYAKLKRILLEVYRDMFNGLKKI